MAPELEAVPGPAATPGSSSSRSAFGAGVTSAMLRVLLRLESLPRVQEQLKDDVVPEFLRQTVQLLYETWPVNQQRLVS